MGRLPSKAMSAAAPLPMRAEHEVVADVVAAANAAVAQNARFVVDGDGRRRIVAARAANAGAGNAIRAMPSSLRQRFQLAVARMLLPRARAGMVGHQQFHQRAPRATRPSPSWSRPPCPARPDARTKPQDTRAPTSTTHTRHTPTGVSFC